MLGCQSEFELLFWLKKTSPVPIRIIQARIKVLIRAKVLGSVRALGRVEVLRRIEVVGRIKLLGRVEILRRAQVSALLPLEDQTSNFKKLSGKLNVARDGL